MWRSDWSSIGFCVWVFQNRVWKYYEWLSLMNIHSRTPNLIMMRALLLHCSLPSKAVLSSTVTAVPIDRIFVKRRRSVTKHERGQTRTVPIPTLTVFTALLCIFVESYGFLRSCFVECGIVCNFQVLPEVVSSGTDSFLSHFGNWFFVGGIIKGKIKIHHWIT